MPDTPKKPLTMPVSSRAFVTHQETSTVAMSPDVILKPGAIQAQGGVLTVKNAELANLINSKIAAASQLAGGRNVASDADVSVGIKVHF